MPDDFHRLIGTLRRLKVVGKFPTVHLPRVLRRQPRGRAPVAAVPDPPRVLAPSLEHALRQPRIAWLARCPRCGVHWRGTIRDHGQDAAVLATLAVLRVPCPVCWALAWSSADQATRAAWSAVPSCIWPRWR